MYALVPVTLLAWIPITVMLFMALPPRRAVIACFVAGWMFLPMGQISIEGIPNFTKFTAVGLSALIGVLAFDSKRLKGFRLSWLDAPMAVMCVAPFFSSLTNDLGLYDGVSAIVHKLTLWGLPYFIGRLYFTDLDGLRELAIGVLLGALVYVPLALFEIRMSPQLHIWVYGYPPSGFMHHMRFGGFRPVVFMQSGLMTGFFLGVGGLVGGWMYLTGALRRLGGVELLAPLVVLGITVVLAKAIAAAGLTMMGFAALMSVKGTRWRLAIWVLALLPMFYIGLRSTETWSGDNAVRAAAALDERRARSLEFRMENETELAARAWERPILGWGRWGDARIKDELGRDQSITDGLWIITFGNEGLVGLAALVLALVLPSLLLLRRCPRRWWYDPVTAPAAALAVVPLMFAVDSLLNAMLNPVWVLIIGGLTSYYLITVRVAYRQRRREQASVAMRRRPRRLGRQPVSVRH